MIMEICYITLFIVYNFSVRVNEIFKKFTYTDAKELIIDRHCDHRHEIEVICGDYGKVYALSLIHI